MLTRERRLSNHPTSNRNQIPKPIQRTQLKTILKSSSDYQTSPPFKDMNIDRFKGYSQDKKNEIFPKIKLLHQPVNKSQTNIQINKQTNPSIERSPITNQHHNPQTNPALSQLLHQPTHKPQTNTQVILKLPTILPISKLESGLGTTKDKICRWLLRLSNVNLSRVHRVHLLRSTSNTL